MEFTFILLLLLFTVPIYGQFIFLPPYDATGTVGASVTFECKVDLEAVQVLSWDFNDRTIYNFQYGVEDYPSGQTKYKVDQDGRSFVLTIKDLDFTDGGQYTCKVIKETATANLIVIDEPMLTTAPFNDNMNAIQTCEARYGGPRKAAIASDHYPQLIMSLDGAYLERLFNETEFDTPFHYFLLKQSHFMTLERNMNTKQLACEIKTLNPRGTRVTIIDINELCNTEAWKFVISITSLIMVIIICVILKMKKSKSPPANVYVTVQQNQNNAPINDNTEGYQEKEEKCEYKIIHRNGIVEADKKTDIHPTADIKDGHGCDGLNGTFTSESKENELNKSWASNTRYYTPFTTPSAVDS